MGKKVSVPKLEPSVSFSITMVKRIDSLLAELASVRSDRSAYNLPEMKEVRKKKQQMVDKVTSSKEYKELEKLEEDIDSKYDHDKTMLERRVAKVRRKWKASTSVTDRFIAELNELVEWVNGLED